jgi:hypothetical protein
MPYVYANSKRSSSHAEAILTIDFPTALAEIDQVLDDLRIPITEIIGSGGGETKGTQRMRRALAAQGWEKHEFVIAKTIDGTPREATSHEIDHVKVFALNPNSKALIPSDWPR